MANTLRFKRGLASGIPTGVAGEPLFTTDTFDLYIGNGATNTRFQKYIASGTTSQLLRGDGSLLTMPIVLTSPANGEVLKYNGTTWVNSSDAGITGSGLAGQVAYFTGATTQAGSNNLFWDSANGRLGIGTNAPAVGLDARNGVNLYTSGASANSHYLELISTTSTDGYVNFRRNGGANGPVAYYLSGGTARFSYSALTGDSTLGSYAASPLLFVTNTAERGRFTTLGNLHLGTFTSDSGQRLQVTGTALISDSLRVDGVISQGTAPEATVNFYMIRALSSGVNPAAFAASSTINSNATTSATYFLSQAQTQAAAFTLPNIYHFRATQLTIGAGSTVTNQYGFFADSTLVGATNDYGFYGNLAAATNVWNLYMNGTANNYMAGSLAIGTTTPSRKLSVVGTTDIISYSNGTTTGYLYSDNNGVGLFNGATATGTGIYARTSNILDLYYNGNIGLRLNNLGRVLIGSTTDTTETLQVTGTAKITGNLTVDTNTLFVDATNDRVGIGTSSPAYRLTVAGDEELRVIGSSAQTNYLRIGTYIDGTAGSYIAATTNYSASSSSNLIFGTTSTAGVRTDRMLLDASGNLGLGVTPSAWFTAAATSVLQIRHSSFYSQVDGTNYYTFIGSNFFQDSGTFYKYINSSFAALYTQFNGRHIWSIAPSGTAGNNITFTQAMTLYNSGNLAIGSAASDSGQRLQVTGTALITGATNIGGILYAENSGGNIRIKGTTDGGIWTAGSILRLADWATGTKKLDIDLTTGAATFSSSVTAGGNMLIQKSQPQIQLYQTGADHNYSILGNTNTALEFWHGTFGSNTTKMLSLAASTGAATFNSSVTAGGNLLLTNGTAASIGAINLIRTGTSPVASRMTFGTDDTGYSFAIAKNVTGTVTDLVTIADSGAATFSSSIQAASATITGNLTVDSSTFFVDATANEVGIGTNAPNSVLQVVGSVSKSISDVKTANYTATATDHTILCSAAGGGFTITLPAASGITGRIYVIKKTNASSGVNSVTVDGNGAETIDGSASINLACKSSVMLQCDGSNWHILSLYSDTSCI